jgi:hypothetical protein
MHASAIVQAGGMTQEPSPTMQRSQLCLCSPTSIDTKGQLSQLAQASLDATQRAVAESSTTRRVSERNAILAPTRQEWRQGRKRKRVIWRDVRATARGLMQDGTRPWDAHMLSGSLSFGSFWSHKKHTHAHACAPNGVKGAVARVASFTSTFNDRVGFRVVVSSWGRHVS